MEVYNGKNNDKMNIIKNPSDDDYKKILGSLKRGKLVVYPTDTIYGIAADINNEEAVRKVFLSKKRAFDKPISASFHDYNQLCRYTKITGKTDEIIKKLLPGPYTLILEKNSNVNSLLTANTEKLGVRIPDNNVSYHLTKYFPITTTSANITGEETPDNINDIKNSLDNEVSVYIDGGIIKNNNASTIIDLTGRKPEIIRKTRKLDNNVRKILKTRLI